VTDVQIGIAQLARVPKPRCPYPAGTDEHREWWDWWLLEAAHEADLIHRLREVTLRELGRMQHLHRFDPTTRVCMCGRSEAHYHAQPPMTRDVCPLVKILAPSPVVLVVVPVTLVQARHPVGHVISRSWTRAIETVTGTLDAVRSFGCWITGPDPWAVRPDTHPTGLMTTLAAGLAPCRQCGGLVRTAEPAHGYGLLRRCTECGAVQ
jgi:hypothetical protein